MAAVHHDFGYKVDDGRGRLFGLEFREDVALVVRLAGRLARYETKTPIRADRHSSFVALRPPTIVRIQAAVGDGRHGIVSAEEQLSFVVRQRYTLTGHLKVHDGSRWKRFGEEFSDSSYDSLRSGEGLCVDG